jgi:hypothetical protein
MSTKNLRLRLAAVVAVSAIAATAANGCSGDNGSGPAPSNHDGGGDATGSSGSSSGGSSSGSDASGSSSGDGAITDTGSCTPDGSANCNSCSTVASDPLNACAPETVNCIPFTKTVPSHPTL